MKKTFFTTICIMVFAGVTAQAPQGISHQAVIRNAAGELITNAPVGIQVSILQGSAEGTVVFSETHTPQSNANGLITFVIGQGADQSSDFSAIDWDDGLYFVKTEADPEGGTNYTIEGVSQLWSVPFALSAGTSGAGIAAGDSLVLKDEEGMTRFVLNPNTGMLKMMHNDTVWYSIEVGSPHVITHLNDDGSLTVSKGNGYEIFVLDEDSKENYPETKTFYKHEKHEPNKQTFTEITYNVKTGNRTEEHKTEIEQITDEDGNIMTKHITSTDQYFNEDGSEYFKKLRFQDQKSDYFTEHVYENGELTYHSKKYFNEDGEKVVEEEFYKDGKVKRQKSTWVPWGHKLLSIERFEEEKIQSKTTYSESKIPDMGFNSQTVTEETFQGEDETPIKKEINTKSSKHSPDEKYEATVTTNQFYKDGVISREVIESLVDQWDETVKIQERTAKMYNPAGDQVSEIKVTNTSDANYDPEGGSMSRSNTTEMFADGVKIADQNRSMEHYPDPSNYTTDSESSATYLPDGSLISKNESQKSTWPGGTLELTSDTYIDSSGSTIKVEHQKNNGLPQNSLLIKDGIYRENTSHTHNDDINKVVTSFKNADNNTTAKLTEEFNKNDAIHTTTVEDPFVSSTSISQGSSEIELTADQVVTDGDQVVTGNLNTLGDSSVSGNQDVFGNLNVSGSKNFRIKHPADHNKYLLHAAIESNEVLNQYSGNVTTGADGLATVTLPDYFHLINIDFRYQLTIIGAKFARAIIFGEIDEKNQFVIKTDEPNTKVSWQVTAKRNDQYLIDNPFSDVVDK